MAIYPQYNPYGGAYQPQMSPTYMSASQQSQPPQPQPQPQPSNGIIWVQGEAGAKSYLVAPNSTVQLWDSEAQVIYLKSADASGMPSIKTLDYTIRDIPAQATPSVAVADYATTEELNALKKQIEALNKKIRTMTKEDKANE